MLVLSGRVHEKIQFPGCHTTIQVVSIHSGVVRLSVEAPEERPGRGERGPGPKVPGEAPTPAHLGQLVDKRLGISQRGLAEMGRLLRAGAVEEAEVLLDKITEDLHLLRRRVGHGSDVPDRVTSA
jgi:hypothetical protein